MVFQPPSQWKWLQQRAMMEGIFLSLGSHCPSSCQATGRGSLPSEHKQDFWKEASTPGSLYGSWILLVGPLLLETTLAPGSSSLVLHPWGALWFQGLGHWPWTPEDISGSCISWMFFLHSCGPFLILELGGWLFAPGEPLDTVFWASGPPLLWMFLAPGSWVSDFGLTAVSVLDVFCALGPGSRQSWGGRLSFGLMS